MINRRDFLKTLPIALAGMRTLGAVGATSRYWVYLGSQNRFGNEKGRSLYRCSFDPGTGKCGIVTTAAELNNPTWLAASRDGRYLYSVSGPVEKDSNGFLTSFAIGRKTGALQRLNQVSSEGGDPTYVSLDRTGKTAVVANFRGGSTVLFPINSDGSLGAQTSLMQHTGTGPHRRQTAPHAHAAVVSPDNAYVLSPDLGADRIFIFRLDASRGVLAPGDPPFVRTAPGFGPRHLVFHPSGRFVYLLTEMGGRIVVFSWHSGNGLLKEIQTVDAYPDGYQGNRSGAEIDIDHAGRFLYTSTRANSSITVHAIHPAQGTLTSVEREPSAGDSPWSFRLDPTGRFALVANNNSDEVKVFRTVPQSGKLIATGETAKVPGPVCIVFVAAQS
jgi:6-phosphogluconolactonase